MQRLLDAVHTRAIKLGCDLRLKPFTITVAGLAEHVLGVVDALCELCEKSSEAGAPPPLSLRRLLAALPHVAFLPLGTPRFPCGSGR